MGHTESTRKYILHTNIVNADHLRAPPFDTLSCQRSGSTWTLTGNLTPSQMAHLLTQSEIVSVESAEKLPIRRLYFIQTDFAFKETLLARLQEAGLTAIDYTQVSGFWGYLGSHTDKEIAATLSLPFVQQVYPSRNMGQAIASNKEIS